MKSLHLLAAVLLPSIIPAQAPTTRPPIIDVHFHAFDPVMLHHLGVDSSSYPEYKRRSLAALEQFNVHGFAGGPAATVREWKRELPGRIYSGYMVFNPGFPDEPFEPDTIRAMVDRGELDMLGEVAAQYLRMEPADPRLAPFWAVAAELDIPIGYHMGPGTQNPSTSVFPNYRASLSNPLLLEEVLNRHPDLRLFVMHAGWPMLDEMVSVLQTYPNVYVGIGVLDRMPDAPNYVRRLVEAGYEDRIMYGSDQMAWPELIETSIASIEKADYLTEEQKRKILYLNAVRFFRLEANPPGQ